jgi:hypothetical protein
MTKLNGKYCVIGSSDKSSDVKEMRVYASDVQSGLLRAYLFRFLPPTHSKIVMICEIRDVSCVVNPCFVGKDLCHASTSKLQGMFQDWDRRWPP